MYIEGVRIIIYMNEYKQNNVPIAYSTDDNYAMPVSVSIKSIIDNSNNKDYEFVILYNNNLNETSKNIIDSSIKGTKCTVRYIDIKDSIKNVYLVIPHISASAYYRLLLPTLLKDYDKCIYLDGDTIAVDNIEKLMQIELSENEYIGAVKCESVLNNVSIYKENHIKELKIKNLSQYINDGVMLLNLKELRNKNMVNTMVDMIKNNYSVQDQDIYNVACFGHIKIIHPMFNVTPGILEKTRLELKNAYSFKESKEARLRPIIVHFLNNRKPWLYEGMEYGSIWDKYYEELYNCKIKNRKKYSKSSFVNRIKVVAKKEIKYILRKIIN